MSFAEDRRCAIAALHEAWRSLRDGNSAEAKNFALGMVYAYFKIGLLEADDRELWGFRLDECPGHADEGGRDWCAYCGKMPRSAP